MFVAHTYLVQIQLVRQSGFLTFSLVFMELRCGLITSHTLFHLSSTSHSNSYYLIYRWGTWGTECWRALPELTPLWLADPWCELILQPESGARKHNPMPSPYGAGKQECKAEGKGLHATIFSGQFNFGSATVLPLVGLQSPEMHPPAPTGHPAAFQGPTWM